jgi:hypothetical protein
VPEWDGRNMTLKSYLRAIDIRLCYTKIRPIHRGPRLLAGLRGDIAKEMESIDPRELEGCDGVNALIKVLREKYNSTDSSARECIKKESKDDNRRDREFSKAKNAIRASGQERQPIIRQVKKDSYWLKRDRVLREDRVHQRRRGVSEKRNKKMITSRSY